MLPTPQPPSSIKKSPLSAATLCIRRLWEYCIEEVDDPMAERRADALLVASSVIAAMNYQAVLSPPGGSFQATEYRITRVDKPEQEQTGHTNILSMKLDKPLLHILIQWSIDVAYMKLDKPWYVIAGVAFAAFVEKLLEPPLTSGYRRATQKT